MAEHPLNIDFNVPFIDAIRWADQREVVLPDIYFGELQGFARAQAFSIAGISSIHQLERVLFSLNDNLESGTSFEAWREKVLAGDVPLDLPDFRLENIYRTNVQNHFAHGRWQQMERHFDEKPMLLYDAVNDSRTRPAHAAMDGFTARHDAAIWGTWAPTNGFNCRCRLISLSEEQSQRFVDEDTARQSNADRANARANAIVGGPDRGWDYNPGRDPAESTRRAAEAAIKANPTFAGQLESKLAAGIDGVIDDDD